LSENYTEKLKSEHREELLKSVIRSASSGKTRKVLSHVPSSTKKIDYTQRINEPSEM
jgi:hypothetical protein